MPCIPKALQKAARASQPRWCLQGSKPLSCLMPRAMCTAQARPYEPQPSKALLSMQVALLSLFQLCAIFSPLGFSSEPVLLPWQPGNASHSQGTGYSLAQEGHLTHGQGHAVQCQQGKELGVVQKEAWDGCLQAWQLSEGQSLVTCSRWSRMRLPEGLAEVETVETGSGG